MRPEQQLATAIQQKQKASTVVLLGQHPDLLNQVIHAGRAPLHLAVESGSLEMVQAIGDIKGVDLNIRIQKPGDSAYDGLTPVFLASSTTSNPHNKAILDYLLEKKVDLSIASANGQTPLFIAISRDQFDRAQAIIRAADNKAERMNANSVWGAGGGRTVLIAALEYSNVAMVRLVLGISGLTIVNHKQTNGLCALSLAASWGYVDKVKALLEFPGIDLEAKWEPGDGTTAMQVATSRGYPAVAELIRVAIKVKQAMSELAALIDMKAVTADPLVQESSPVSTAGEQQGEEEKKQQVAGRITPYSDWLKTQYKMPSAELLCTYLTELKQKLDPAVTPLSWRGPFITATERSYSHARLLWTQAVSDMDRVNREQKADYFQRHGISMAQAVANRLTQLGHPKNPKDPEGICRDIVRYVQDSSALVITFKAAEIMGKGLTDYTRLNMSELGSGHWGGSNYPAQRDATEQELFQRIDAKLREGYEIVAGSGVREGLFSNIHARPRYGSFMFLDAKHPVAAFTSFDYGRSYVKFRQAVKLNGIFVSCNSFQQKFTAKKPLWPCTYHHFEIFLLYCSDDFLKALAQRVTTGTLPVDFVNGAEVLLPSLNVLDPSCVETIYIHPSEHRLTVEEKTVLTTKMGLNVVNTDNPYPAVIVEWWQCIEINNVARARELLTVYPSLVHVANPLGEEAVHLAAKKGLSEMVKLLVAKGAAVNVLESYGRAPLHLAVESGSLETVQALGDAKDVNLNIRMRIPGHLRDGITPVLMASYYNSGSITMLHYLLGKKADIGVISENGQTPLTTATWYNKVDRVQALITAGVTAERLSANNVTTMSGNTALTDAVEKCNAAMVRLILTIPGLTIVNHKKKNGESALFMAASQGDVLKVMALLNCPGIDREAKRLPGDGKTALQIATEKGHTEVVRVFNLCANRAHYEPAFTSFFTNKFFVVAEAELSAQLQSVKSQPFYQDLCRFILDARGLALLVKHSFALLNVLIEGAGIVPSKAGVAAGADAKESGKSLWGVRHLAQLLRENTVVEDIKLADRSLQKVGALLTQPVLRDLQTQPMLAPLWPAVALAFATAYRQQPEFASQPANTALAQEIFSTVLKRETTNSAGAGHQQ